MTDVDNLERRFEAFVRLNIEIQELLQTTLERSILNSIPDVFPLSLIRNQVVKEFETTRAILNDWQKRVKDQCF